MRLVATLLLTLLLPGAALAQAPVREATVIGHRGASAYAPENTLPAVELAIEQGSDLVEIDIQLSLDRQIVLMHDTTLTKTTNVEEVVGPMDPRGAFPHVGLFTAAELAALDAGCWGRFEGGEFCGAHVPTLRETLNLFRDHPDVGILIEVKAPDQHPGIEEVLALELAAFRNAGFANPHVVQSFDHDSMARYDAYQQQLGLDYEVGALGVVAPALFDVYGTFADQINPSHNAIDPAYVAAVQAAGFSVNPYTINDQCRMVELIDDFGVDGIITDRPDLLNEVLAPDEDKAAELAACPS